MTAQPTNFIDACLSGAEQPANIYDWVERWHHLSTDVDIKAWLGMTEEEYHNWVLAPETLEHILAIRKMLARAEIRLSTLSRKITSRLN